MQFNHPVKIYSILTGLILAWSSIWPVAKLGLAYMPPIWFAFARTLGATITMFIIVACMRKLHLPKKQDYWLLFSLSLFQMAAFLILVTVGLSLVSAGQSAVLTYTTPVWTSILAFIFLKERTRPLQIIGIALGMLGIVLILAPWHTDWQDKAALLGNGLLIGAALIWSAAILISRYSRWHSTPLELISWQLLLATIVMLVVAIFLEPQPKIIWNLNLFWSLLFSSTIGTAFGYWSIIWLSKELPSQTLSVSLLSVPVLSLLLSHLMLREALTPTLLIATGLILAGLLVILYSSYYRSPLRNLGK